MNVKNETFYHVRQNDSHSSDWELGSKITFGQNTLNDFASFYEDQQLVFDLYVPDDRNPDGKTAIRDKPIESMEYIKNNNLYLLQDIRRIIDSSYDVIKEMSLFLRETIWEEVRMDRFPDLPSRKHCVWLCEKHSVSYWYGIFNNSKKILQVSATGKIHKADQRLLAHSILPGKELRTRAIKYWEGADGEKPEEEEILFEGTLEVVREFEDLDEFTKSV